MQITIDVESDYTEQFMTVLKSLDSGFLMIQMKSINEGYKFCKIKYQ